MGSGHARHDYHHTLDGGGSITVVRVIVRREYGLLGRFRSLPVSVDGDIKAIRNGGTAEFASSLQPLEVSATMDLAEPINSAPVWLLVVGCVVSPVCWSLGYYLAVVSGAGDWWLTLTGAGVVGLMWCGFRLAAIRSWQARMRRPA